MLVLAVVGLVASVNAHKGGGGGGRRDGGYRGGYSSSGDRDNCDCASTNPNRCANNTGSTNFACYRSRVQYIGCQDQSCSVNYCATNSLFNFTSKVCEACPSGFHVDIRNRTCVCDQGTTFNRTTKTCVSCPTNAVVTADRCYCQNAALDRTTNACKECPAGSSRRGSECRCNDRTQFWNDAAFACQNCPGAWVTVQQRRGSKQVCRCQGANEFFNQKAVACVTCPTNSVAVNQGDDSYCRCNTAGERYDFDTNTCGVRSATDFFDSSSHDRY